MTAIQKNRGNTFAVVGIRRWGGRIATLKQLVYDGDTIHVRAVDKDGKDEAFAVRFLGIDTPENKIPLPENPDTFVSLDDPRWDALLTDPFVPNGPLDPAKFSTGLKNHIMQCAGSGQAAIHKKHCGEAEEKLESLIESDIKAMNATNETFRFYLRFAFEVMDRYGRFLCYVNRYQEEESDQNPRPPTLNERLLTAGMAFPYFIWPNINPWRSQSSKVQAVLKPNTAKTIADGDSALSNARRAVRNARNGHLGIFNAVEPLTFEPLEIRYFGSAGLPSRWLIDLGRNDDVLIHPQNYWTIPNQEDRLYIPEEYVPLFVSQGWKQQPAP